MSGTARQFLILRNWVMWQYELPLSPRAEDQLEASWAKLRRDASFIIGFMA